MDYMKKYEYWLNSEAVDEKDKEELRNLAGNEKEIEDRFFKDLSFGTGGIRGVRGIGTNRINKYVIRKATQGLANYMLGFDEKLAKEKGIIIAQRYKENQGKILGVASAVGSLGTAIGSLLSGHLLNFNPFFPFVVNIIVMFFVLVLILVKKL